MNKKIWDIYAPIYEKAMHMDKKYYGYMYDRIPVIIKDKEVLEIATGPGLLAKHVAHFTKKMLATDYSDGMIKEAKKGEYPNNLTFEVADATSLPYNDNSFDVVIIANDNSIRFHLELFGNVINCSCILKIIFTSFICC